MNELISVVESVLSEMKNHTAFDVELFENKDYDELCDIGGEVCTITIWAIELSEALEQQTEIANRDSR